MIPRLFLYAAALTAFILAGTLATHTPLEQVAWLVLLVEVVPLATWGAAMSIRRTSRKARQDWQHLTCDPVAPPLPAPAPRVRIERVEPKLLEAPGTKEIDYAPRNVARISGKTVYLLTAPTDHRDGRATD